MRNVKPETASRYHADAMGASALAPGKRSLVQARAPGGAPLPDETRGRMEASFGADFSAVRVHVDERAAAVGARAYARGTDLHFAPGAYDPHSREGQSLLGHELAHVVQQGQGRVAAPQAKAHGLGDLGDVVLYDPGLEAEADRLGEAAARGERVPSGVAPSIGGLGGAIQRKGEHDDDGLQLQEQITVAASAPSFARAAAALRARGVAVTQELALMIEETAAAETRVEADELRLRLDDVTAELAAIGREHAAIEGRVADADETPELVMVRHDLAVVTEIRRTTEKELVALNRSIAQKQHQDRLDALAQPSTAKERARVDAMRSRRSAKVTATDVREIDNWVSGTAGGINNHLLGRESTEERDARRVVVEQGRPDDAWKVDYEARCDGLDTAMEHLPSRPGTTYRRATFESIDVFTSRIQPGDFISSKAFWATSLVKGAEGACGGADTWGTKAGHVYYEVTGASGKSLGAYQENLGGEREVLYQRSAVFQVEAIEVRGTTALVIVSQVVVPEGTPRKDPHTGRLVEDEPDLR
jgi:hypothetical protein